MSWKKIDNQKSNPWLFEEMGDLEGEYLLSREAKSKKGKPITFHEFRLDNKEVVSVLGGTVLDRIFSQVEEGTKVKIEFKGEAEGKRGNYKNYEVSIWEE